MASRRYRMYSKRGAPLPRPNMTCKRSWEQSRLLEAISLSAVGDRSAPAVIDVQPLDQVPNPESIGEDYGRRGNQPRAPTNVLIYCKQLAEIRIV